MLKLERIVSGGQTGADRAALDFAIEHGIPHAGWCPKGRLAEDGVIDSRYQLTETPSSSYSQRTRWNVRDSDGTLIFSIAARLQGGSKDTMDLARKLKRPVLHLWREDLLDAPEKALLRFIRDNTIQVINVAGARASTEPEIAAFVTQVLQKTFELLPKSRGTKSVQPCLETPRLMLRPFSAADAPTIARLAGRREIADTTISIPHPYSQQHAREWIARATASWSEDNGVVFAVITKGSNQLVGAVGLAHVEREHSQAEMGYWIAVGWWGRGFATEATKALIEFGIETLGLNRIYAHHMLRNPASGGVMEKIGMKKEGVLRERLRKWSVFEDVAIFSILKKDWRRVQKFSE